MAAALLAGCSSSVEPQATSSAPTTPPSSTASPAASERGASLDFAPSWSSTALQRDGSGYAMTVSDSAQPGLYDGRLSFQLPDGASTGVQFIAMMVDGRGRLTVRWPDATEHPGTLTIAGDGRTVEAIDLGDECIAGLPEGEAPDNCILAAGTVTPITVPSNGSSVTPAPSVQEVPTVDEAMSYLCSASIPELARVTSPKSDPYAVAVLQHALTLAGHDPGGVDGHYGPKSQQAVRDFQSEAGITVDGLVGPQTWTALQAAACLVASDPAR
jgi:hypothetical protein